MSVGIDPAASLGGLSASTASQQTQVKSDADLAAVSQPVAPSVEGQKDDAEISPKGQWLSHLSEANREAISDFRRTIEQSIADGSYDPMALAEQAPEVLKQFADAADINLAKAIDMASFPENWQRPPMMVSTAVSVYTEVVHTVHEMSGHWGQSAANNVLGHMLMPATPEPAAPPASPAPAPMPTAPEPTASEPTAVSEPVMVAAPAIAEPEPEPDMTPATSESSEPAPLANSASATESGAPQAMVFEAPEQAAALQAANARAESDEGAAADEAAPEVDLGAPTSSTRVFS